MVNPVSHRAVRLVDNRTPDRPLIVAVVYQDYAPEQLNVLEARWADARAEVAEQALLEHEHWDWRNKADGVEAGRHRLVAVECEGEPQGVMAITRTPRPARLGPGHVVYIDYLEAAPWNLKGAAHTPRFLGVGTVLMAEAVRLSLDAGLAGRVGLHALPQAEPFYDKCRMIRIGPDPHYFDLVYYEFTGPQAVDWLAAIGGMV